MSSRSPQENGPMPGRRTFLSWMTGAGGLCLGVSWGCKGDTPARDDDETSSSTTVAKSAQASAPVAVSDEPGSAGVTPGVAEGEALNAWISVTPDGSVHLTIAESEMGQGILTGLSMVLAEALDVPWSQVRGHQADSDDAYGRQSTGGSTSVRSGGFEAMTTAGKAARALLVQAAADRWNLAANTLRTEGGVVVAPDGQRLSYGALANEAAARSKGEDLERLAASVPARSGATTLLGTSPPRLDIPSKVDGTAIYGMDVRRPGMRFASVERCPVFGGALESAEPDSLAAAKAVPGVLDTVQLEHGVAVVGRSTWACFQGRRALRMTWSSPTEESAPLSSAVLRERAVEALDRRPVEAHIRGRGVEGLKLGARQLEAEYEIPYLAHAPMEPLNCTVEVSGEGDARRCTVWVPTQSPTKSRRVAAKELELPESSVRVVRTMLGGGFGRRSETDFVRDAARIAARIGGCVQVVWTREDDIRGGAYRPMALSRLRGALDADGWPIAWSHDLASPSILRSIRGGRVGQGVDPSSVEGASEIPYSIPHQRVRYADVAGPVSTWWWRSVGSSMNAYFVEHFLDELARLGDKDPYEVRRRLLGDHPRHLAVLDAAARAASWGMPLPEGRAQGIAVHESYGSFVAQVAEVSLSGNGRPRVHALTCAVDCGQQIHPDAIRAQMEGSVAYGLSAALYGEIKIAQGRAVQSNFHDYPILRMDEMPRVEVVLVKSEAAHGGVGEPGVPPVAPAICNALLALTGSPRRRLPLMS